MKDESSADRPRSCADEAARDTVKRNKDEQEKDPKKPIKKERILNWKWTARIFLLTFFISVGLSFFSESVSEQWNIWVALAILLVFIFIGILFDVIGTAVMSADPKSLNSMCTRQVRGAKRALKWT